jgi:putative DNA primase/helicase
LIGTQSNPVQHAEPAKIAEALLHTHFRTPEKRPGLWTYQGAYYVWNADKWMIRDADWLRDTCWVLLEDLYVSRSVNGQVVAARYGVDSAKVSNVMEAITAKTRIPYTKIPCFLGRSEDIDPECTISFENQLVCVEGGNVVTLDRDETYFDPIVVPCDYDPDAEYPVWARCLDEWSGGDDRWKDLLQRWFGYCLLPHNRYARWLLMYGKVRSGKGTIAKVLESLLGLDAYIGTSLYSLSNRFGLDGLQSSRVLCVHEVSELDSKDGERCTQVLKSILGQDRIDIDRKGLSMVRNVTIDAKPMVQSNEIPRLPNKGQGLSSKMLLLPFEVSFLKQSDERLIDKLRKELPGIAAWAVEGALKVEAETDTKARFPMPESSEEAIRLYLYTNNPFDSFLGARFIQADDGFVATEMIWRQWEHWIDRNKVRGMHVSRNQLTVKLEQESTWNLRRYRPSGGQRGMRGLRLRSQYDDEE